MMSELIPAKLHTHFVPPTQATSPRHPRWYTLTHSDRTGDMFLTIAAEIDQQQIAGWYTRLMRDEVVAEWQYEAGRASLNVHCHVSGGLIVGGGAWRVAIFRGHMSLVLEAFRHGDRAMFQENPELDQAQVWVHFHARQKELNLVEPCGVLGDYKQECSTTS
ncbi:MAG: hypothetical protein E4G99_01450 [Anaerolineales bacterium]|nr:MAG: hypothetical protein E4G99_01450 [Anaerolineales bacterium]